jgi:hypothetical protein
VLFAAEEPSYAHKCLATAHALYSFAYEYPELLKSWADGPATTYPSTNPAQFLLWGASVLSWAHTCGKQETGGATCNPVAATKYWEIAAQMWVDDEVRYLHAHLNAPAACKPESSGRVTCWRHPRGPRLFAGRKQKGVLPGQQLGQPHL